MPAGARTVVTALDEAAPKEFYYGTELVGSTLTVRELSGGSVSGPIESTPPVQPPENAVPPQESGPTEPTEPADDHIYGSVDPGNSVVLPIELLENVTDLETAVSAVQTAAADMTGEQRQSPTGIDLVTLYAEEAVAQAASMAVSGDIVVNQSNVQDLQTKAMEVRNAAEQSLSSNNVAIQRQLQADVNFKTDSTASVTIRIEPSAANTTADNVRIETPAYIISLSAESIKENTGDSPLIITISQSGTVSQTSSDASSRPLAPLVSPGIELLPASAQTTYTVTFNKPVSENVRISLPPASGDPTYQAVVNSAGNPVGGKYNPVTNKIEAKIIDSGTYTVKDNRKDFTDITTKSREMQNAINVLASKGIINGTSATTFSPDSPINRAEIAALIVRTLSKLDPNADGGFNDVLRSDWYFGAIGSAKRYGIINGMTDTTFAPRSNITKEQIVAICARTLRAEMKYRDPADVNAILSIYADAASIPQWGRADIALATRQDIVVRRTDGRFNGTATMTRGDAAIILYRMFMKIW